MEELSILKEKIRAGRPASWDAFPDLALYMDQVVSYLKQHSKYLDHDETPLTSAMINNYIKSGLLPRTKGKKYGKEHLSSLFVISLLKNSLSVMDMKQLLQDQAQPGGEKAFYDEFIRIVDETFSMTADAMDENMDEDGLSSAALQFAVTACACKLVCEEMLEILRKKRPVQPAEKPSKKNKGSAAQ